MTLFMNYVSKRPYDRIDISEGIDVNKTRASKDCDICHFWHFKEVLTMNFIFEMVVMI